MSPQELPSIAETDAVASSGLSSVLARIERQERRRRRTRRGVLVGVPSALVIAGLVAVTAPASPFSPFGGGESASSSGVSAGSVGTPEPYPGSATSGSAAEPASGTAPSGPVDSHADPDSASIPQAEPLPVGGLALVCHADGRTASSDTPVTGSADPADLCASLLGLTRGALADAAACAVPGGTVAVYAAPDTCAAHDEQPWKG